MNYWWCDWCGDEFTDDDEKIAVGDKFICRCCLDEACIEQTDDRNKTL